jgi:hypothetical protein
MKKHSVPGMTQRFLQERERRGKWMSGVRVLAGSEKLTKAAS